MLNAQLEMPAQFNRPAPFEPSPLTSKMEQRGDHKFKILSIDGRGIRINLHDTNSANMQLEEVDDLQELALKTFFIPSSTEQLCGKKEFLSTKK